MSILRKVKVAETNANKRRVYFELVDTAGAAVTSQAGGQPKISIDGGAWTTDGIGTLTHIGSGVYYADLTTATVAVGNKHKLIRTLYDGVSNPAQVFGDVVEIIDNIDGYTIEEVAKFLLAYVAGQTAGAGTNIIAFKDPAGTNARITMTVDADGDRTSVTLSTTNL